MGFYINWTSILGLSVIILNNSQKLLKAIFAKKKINYRCLRIMSEYRIKFFVTSLREKRPNSKSTVIIWIMYVSVFMYFLVTL